MLDAYAKLAELQEILAGESAGSPVAQALTALESAISIKQNVSELTHREVASYVEEALTAYPDTETFLGVPDSLVLLDSYRANSFKSAFTLSIDRRKFRILIEEEGEMR